MRVKKQDLEDALRQRAAELQKSWVVGDKSVTWQLVGELKSEYPKRTEDALYQMIRYYLKTESDTRRGYSLMELQTLAISSRQERIDYAKATGRKARAIETAVERFRKSEKVKPEQVEVKLKHTEKKVKDQGYINFGSQTELKLENKTIEDVLKAREVLKERFGLSLRIPNILYHPITKRRYYMNTGEQVALLNDPSKFLRLRIEHIKENWQVKESDPVDDPEVKAAVGKIDRQRVARTPKILNALKVVTDTVRGCGNIEPENTFYAEWCELKELLEEVL